MSLDPFFKLEGSPASLERLVEAGYERPAAELLLSGGFRGLSVEELARAGDMLSLRYASLFGRLAHSSDWQAIVDLGIESTTHLICDSYYQHTFPSWPLADLALYGRDGHRELSVGVDLPRCRPLRVRHREVDAYRAETFDQLAAAHASFAAATAEDQLLLLRGQRRQRLLNRPPEVSQLLYGGSGRALEPSLITAAHRAAVDCDQLLGLLNLELQDRAHAGEDLAGYARRSAATIAPLLLLPASAHEPELPSSRDRLSIPPAGALREMMALAQHYGIPTYGIDLTASLEVAAWFAVHRLVETGEQGEARYEAAEWPGGDPEAWPCLYLFLARGGQRSQFDIPGDLVGEALRPRRQRAFLSSGGWGWHSNAAAEQLHAVVYLGPDVARSSTLPAPGELFPSPASDAFYAFLLERKRRALANPNSPFRELYERLPEIVT